MKNDYFNSVTPFAPFRYIWLGRQDTKFDPKYSVEIVLDPDNDPDHKQFMDDVDELNVEVADELLKGIKKGKKAYSPKEMFKEIEDDDGNPTGKYSLKATTKMKPKVVDADKNIIPDETLCRCYSGTIGRLILGLKKSVVSTRKTVGLTVYLSKAQITEPVFGGSSDFDAVDNGYTVGATDGEAPDF